MLANLKPLEDAAVERLRTWLPKLSHPVRIGEHDQTAFALGLILDYARGKNDERLTKLAADSARKFFLADTNCPLAYEPSGEDFLSPCLGEADVMRRVLSQGEFAKWLSEFLPQIPSTTGNADWLPVAISPDPSDPKLAHLDGLNLSRAWMLEGILSALPADDPRRPALASAAEAHRRAGLAAVTGEHYEGGHWLGSFAVYLTTRRGIENETSRDSATRRALAVLEIASRTPKPTRLEAMRPELGRRPFVLIPGEALLPKGSRRVAARSLASRFRLPRKMLSSAFLMLAIPMG